jgi:hypothetical protein
MSGSSARQDPAGLVLQRRKFLVLGSTGLLSLCFGEMVQAESIVSAEAAVRPMPVGYLDGTDSVPSLRRLPVQIHRPRAWVAEAESGPIRVSFLYPLDWHALPELSMRVVPVGDGPVRTFRTRFTFDDETGLPRLLRGAYVLGTSPNAWRSDIALRSLGPNTPASLVSVLLSMEPEGEI